MNAMGKIKLSKERIQLIADLKVGNLKELDKIKASKRVVEIVVLLGGKAEQPSNEQLSENDYIPEVWISEAKDSKYNESLLKNYKEWFDRDARKFMLDNGFNASGEVGSYVKHFKYEVSKDLRSVAIFVRVNIHNDGHVAIFDNSAFSGWIGKPIYNQVLEKENITAQITLALKAFAKICQQNSKVFGAKGYLTGDLKPIEINKEISEKQALTDWLKQLQSKSVVTVDGKVVRFNRNHSVDHLVHDAIYARKITLKAVEKVVEVFESGDFIGREKLHKARADQFVAFHTYEKWVTLDEGQVRIRAKAGELENGLLEAGNGLIAYTAKSNFDGLKNASPIPHRLTGMRLQGEATDIYHYDEASTFKSQADDYVFIEIVEVIANEQPIENDTKQPNPFFQAVINGEIKFSLQMVSDLLNEVQKDPTAPLVVEATKTAYQAFLDNGYTLDMQDWN